MGQIAGARELGDYLCELANQHDVQSEKPTNGYNDLKAAQAAAEITVSKQDEVS